MPIQSCEIQTAAVADGALYECNLAFDEIRTFFDNQAQCGFLHTSLASDKISDLIVGF